MNPLRTQLFAEALEVRCVPAVVTALAPPLVVVGGQSGGSIGVTRGDASEILHPFGHTLTK